MLEKQQVFSTSSRCYTIQYFVLNEDFHHFAEKCVVQQLNEVFLERTGVLLPFIGVELYVGLQSGCSLEFNDFVDFSELEAKLEVKFQVSVIDDVVFLIL